MGNKHFLYRITNAYKPIRLYSKIFRTVSAYRIRSIIRSLFTKQLILLKMEIDILLKYLEGNLSSPQKEKLEAKLLANPEYFRILKGLSLLKKEFSKRRKLKEYLNKKGTIFRLKKAKNVKFKI